MADTKLLLWIGAFFVAYIAARILFYYTSDRKTEYEKQVKKILVSDKYKVKGRYE